MTTRVPNRNVVSSQGMRHPLKMKHRLGGSTGTFSQSTSIASYTDPGRLFALNDLAHSEPRGAVSRGDNAGHGKLRLFTLTRSDGDLEPEAHADRSWPTLRCRLEIADSLVSRWMPEGEGCGRTTVDRNKHPHRFGEITCFTALSSFRLYRVSAFVYNSICLCPVVSANSPRLAYATVGMRRSHRIQLDMLHMGIAGQTI